MNTVKTYPIMGGILDGRECPHPDDMPESADRTIFIFRTKHAFYRYEFWPGIERWLFDRSAKNASELVDGD